MTSGSSPSRAFRDGAVAVSPVLLGVVPFGLAAGVVTVDAGYGVVETIGHEKCRFPLIAGQWTAWPDGTVQYDSFDHQPDKPTIDDESEPLIVVVESETIRIETADGREVAMWTREELAESPEAFSAAFEAVRLASNEPMELLKRQRAHLDAQSRDNASEQ